MNWNFLGMANWPAVSGTLDLLQSFDVFRAADTATLPRATCESCIVWRESGCCTQVQVEDWEADRQHRAVENGKGYEGMTDCLVSRNCCPILFFDFIKLQLPPLTFTDHEETA